MWTRCDICGRRIRDDEATLIRDIYNPYNGFLVCKKDLISSSPLLKPIRTRERPLPNPKKARSGLNLNNVTYAEDENADRLPGAPRKLMAFAGPLGDYIHLSWEGPEDGGSGRILGYKITRAAPQLSYKRTLVENTGSSVPSYSDTVSPLDISATYTVAAINSVGVGAESDPAFYPTDRAFLGPGERFLIDAETSNVITTGDGKYIVVRSS